MNSVSFSRVQISREVCLPFRIVAKQTNSNRAAIPAASWSKEAGTACFTGLRKDATHSLAISSVQNGSKFFCMRHRTKLPKLGRPTDQRKALLRGLTTEVLKNGRITTTKAKARAVRPYVEKMIGLAKGGSLHERRQAIAWIYDKALVAALFEDVPGRYGEKNGGYTRIFQTLSRKGDNAPMSIIELVD
mmetsp:Transcript_18593/g.25780  ORF Transcript_18593/g.25780 Transcript_18593/m.25780 type:complete len:189 (+) Transcript_18593:121-687(+)|eukprot:CAMPEP_0196578970 /NCGR_PEP_ID=MMETSP1081-20130531/14383_1 /TAXON_ID=36882 /ORGANISM="Pyramimonas amylifera, Strain CCMP720" /LENGTH=188 /DNA_ID=CAMNT_0041898381 /DNA_START=121 /DNA_END=687 /DNA_ORIENTATION=-